MQFKACLATSEDKYKTMALPGTRKTYGNYVRAGALTYARIFGAGHMINENKPKEAKDLFETWILNNGQFIERTGCGAAPP
jgi:cathepsin A (carboxypeptidase C)